MNVNYGLEIFTLMKKKEMTMSNEEKEREIAEARKAKGCDKIRE